MVRKSIKRIDGVGLKAGDFVLIGGLYGDDVNFVNGHLGYIEQVFTMPNPVSYTKGAKVRINENVVVPLNFLFLYNLRTLFTFDNSLFDDNYVANHIKNKKIIHTGFTVGNEGNHYAMLFDVNHERHLHTISTLN